MNNATSHQEGGSHYVKHIGIQPWHIISEYNLDFWEGNVLKYLLREKTDRKEDLKKAAHYIEYLIEQEELKQKKDEQVS